MYSEGALLPVVSKRCTLLRQFTLFEKKKNGKLSEEKCATLRNRW